MKKFKYGCVLVTLLIFTSVILYIIATFDGVLPTTDTAQSICENMLSNELVACSEQCTIGDNPRDYIPYMFPSGVDPSFVELSMAGFYLLNQQKGSSQSIITYWLRKREPMLLNEIGIVLPQKVTFYFNQNEELTHFDINNSTLLGSKVTGFITCD